MSIDNLNRGRDLFLSIKATTLGNSSALALPVGKPAKALLRPISTVKNQINEDDVELLTTWRNKHVNSFLTEFTATNIQTQNWLETAVHSNPGKMLWMVETLDGTKVGHVGLGFINWEAGYGEADAIVSGGESPPGLMKESLITLLSWSKETLGLRDIAVRVRSDNSALTFYRKVGFNELKRVPIVARNSAPGTDWHEDPQAVGSTVHLVYMSIEL